MGLWVCSQHGKGILEWENCRGLWEDILLECGVRQQEICSFSQPSSFFPPSPQPWKCLQKSNFWRITMVPSSCNLCRWAEFYSPLSLSTSFARKVMILVLLFLLLWLPWLHRLLWGQIHPLLDAHMDEKTWYLYTMEYYSAIRKDEYPSFASTWMELEGMMLSKISQLEVNLLF